MKILVIIITGILFLYLVPVGAFLQAKAKGIKISLFQLAGLKFRKIPIGPLFDWHTKLFEKSISIELMTLVDCYKSGFDLDNIVNGLVKAKENRLMLTFNKACEADKKNIDITRTVLNALNNVDKKN